MTRLLCIVAAAALVAGCKGATERIARNAASIVEAAHSSIEILEPHAKAKEGVPAEEVPQLLAYQRGIVAMAGAVQADATKVKDEPTFLDRLGSFILWGLGLAFGCLLVVGILVVLVRFGFFARLRSEFATAFGWAANAVGALLRIGRGKRG